MNQKVLDYYLQFSQYTYPGLYKKILQDLPTDIREIGKLVRHQIIHRMVLKNGNTGSNSNRRYGDMSKVPWYRQPEDDNFVTTAAIAAELYRRDSRGFTFDRLEENKLVLTCRYVSILMASILKSKRIPARVRSGFAPYFVVEGLPVGKSDDHWINQYWSKDEKRWVTIDVDGSLENLGFDPYDVPDNTFDFSPDVWLKIRRGEIAGDHFYNAGGYSGLVVVGWELFYDFHCLMNSEVIYMHTPELVHLDKFDKLTENQLKEIDHLAGLMQDADSNFDELTHIWNTKKEFRLLKGALI